MEEVKRDLPVIAFKSQKAWAAWLASQPPSSQGVWLKLAKKSSGIASVTKPEAIDSALCHGWIDGQLDSFDENHWLIRFTPRRSTSKWSAQNRARALELVALQLMQPAGLAQIERAREDGRWNTAYASQANAQLPEDLRSALARNKRARNFFESLDAANRYAILYRIQDAKKPETRIARIRKYVAMLGDGDTLHPQKSRSSKSKSGKLTSGKPKSGKT